MARLIKESVQWPSELFGSLADFKNGLNFRTHEKGVFLKVLGVGDFQDKTTLTDCANLPAIALDKAPEKEYLLQNEDLVFVRSNGSKDLVGRCLIVYPGDIAATHSGFTIRARVNKNLINPKYVALLTQGGLLKQALASEGRGTNIANLNQDILSKLLIPMPSLKEQELILDFFSEWDKAISLIEALLIKKRELLKGLYQNYFIPQTKFNKHWKKVSISSFLTIRREKAIPSERMPLYSLTIEDGVTKKTDRYDRSFLVKDNNLKTYKVVYPGDIVFNPSNLRWGAIGRSEVTHKVVVSPLYEVLAVNGTNVDSNFIKHALTCPRQIAVFAAKTEGTLIERMAVKADVFLLTEILMPDDINEQKETANIFQLAEQEITVLKKQSEAYRTQKRGLMQKLLTGQWRIKN